MVHATGFGSRLWYGCLLATALTLSACGQVETFSCTSDRGVIFVGFEFPAKMSLNLSCDRFKRQEDAIVSMMGTLGNPYLLAGYKIWVRPEYSWIDDFGRGVGGYTLCPIKEIHIGLENQVFAHEIAHALQNCNPPLPIDEGLDRDHADWTRDRIFQMIDTASLL